MVTTLLDSDETDGSICTQCASAGFLKHAEIFSYLGLETAEIHALRALENHIVAHHLSR